MIHILQRVAKEAGEILIKYFKKDIKASDKKSHKDLVTIADLLSQEYIQKTIVKEMVKRKHKKSDVGFVGEEKMNISGTHKFIIDPLDGTNNFASGFDYFCVSIGYMKNNIPLAGTIYQPTRNFLYIAEKSKGAYKFEKNNKKILKMTYHDLRNSLLVSIFHESKKVSDLEINHNFKLFPFIRGMRTLHSTALDLCNCAENIFNIAISGQCSIWDIAAAKLIIEESGGTMVDLHGNSFNLDSTNSDKSYQFIACHQKLLPEILKFFK